MQDNNGDEFFDEEENGLDEDRQSFEELLNSYDSGMKEDLQTGDKIHGEIIAIGEDTVYVDTGTKIDGIVEKSELLDENGDLPYAMGDHIDLYIVSMKESEIRLSKALAGQESKHLLLDAYKNKIPVEGKVIAVIKGGFHVDVMKNRTFCPLSQIDIYFVKDPEPFVGNSYNFLITQYEERGRNIIVSRKAFMHEDLKEARTQFLKDLQVDKTFEGRVMKLMPYGAFVELFPGIEGMVHISELSWSRVEKPDDIIKEGQTINVKVIGLETKESSNKPKIALSVKQVDGDPWDTIEEKIKKGDVLTGKVTRLTKFGAFVEIAPGIEGLVHLSEMSYVKRIVKPEEVVSAGEIVSVSVKDIQNADRKISLSIKDAAGDPWLEVAEKYRKGQTITGTIEKKEQFGYFINLEPGITGLLPKSKISSSPEAQDIEKKKNGDTITVMVEAVSVTDRKITLGPLQSTDGDAWREFSKESSKPTSALGQKLQKALKSKDKE